MKSKLKEIRIKFKNKKIGLCHGVFDILHYGHMLHFEAAKKKCDILVCSITDDKYVKKGPGQPYYTSSLRSKTLQGIKYIDYVHIEKSISSKNVIEQLKPDLYFKGKDYKTRPDNLGNLKKEKKFVEKFGGKISYTSTELSSSTKIFNWKKEINSSQKRVIENIKKKYSEEYILNIFKKLSEESLNIIGEPIFDEYIECEVLGTTTKDPALSSIVKKISNYNGGVFAISNLISEFCKKVNLITYIKKEDELKIKKLNKNIFLKNIDPKQIIQKKTRFITSNRYDKIFQTTNLISNQLNSKKIINHLTKKLKKTKNLAICDFGLGLFTPEVIKFLEFSKIKLSLNVQTNSVNYGFNLLTKYSHVDMISMDLNEFRLYLGQKNILYADIIKSLRKSQFKFKTASITLNKEGAIYFSKKKEFINFCPVFSDKVVDTTGCGDAYYIMSHALKIINAPADINVFISNCFAGIYASVKGHEHTIKKQYFIKYILSIINI